MHANIGALPEDAAPVAKRRERLISIPYLFLRGSTAGAALAMGFVQTFVLARVLSPERFSIFIVIGAVGYSLWVTDLGLAKILFVNLRDQHLAGRRDEHAARQATAVILLYGLLAVGASLACFAITLIHPASTLRSAAELSLFMLYITLNLAWFSLRTISIAVDLFIYYERLEFVRRALNISMMLAMLTGIPLLDFLIGSNLLWAALLAAASAKLIQRGAITARLRSFPYDLMSFLRMNRHAIARSSTGALGGMFVATFPYYVVPVWFGLGAAPIIVEVTFRIFRGACVIFAAICDLAVPGQTRALVARDADRLIRTTLLVGGLCCVPAALASGLLIFEGPYLFKFLLHSAAEVPHAIVPVIVVLLLASVLQIVSEALLQYSGFFRSLAYNGAAVAAAMIVMTALAIVARLDLVGFLAAYSIVYAAGAIFLTVAAVLGPIRAAAVPVGRNQPPDTLKTIPLAPPMQPAISDPSGTARRIPQPNQNP
jgi:O-antigen/teichoic acid export membrane protein